MVSAPRPIERLRLNVDLNIAKIRSRFCMDERKERLGSKNFFWHLSLQKEAAGTKILEIEIVVKY